MTPDVTLSTYSYGFLFSYFSLSLIILVALYYLKYRHANTIIHCLFSTVSLLLLWESYSSQFLHMEMIFLIFSTQ